MAITSEPIQGKAVSSDDAFWLDLIKTAREGSVKSLDETAKQLIALGPILAGLYTLAVSFAKIDPTYLQTNTSVPFIFLFPIVCWLGSLISAVFALVPQKMAFNTYSPVEARQVYEGLLSSSAESFRNSGTLETSHFSTKTLCTCA